MYTHREMEQGFATKATSWLKRTTRRGKLEHAFADYIPFVNLYASDPALIDTPSVVNC